ERRRQQPRIDDSLRTRLRAGRLHRMCRIADQRDAAEAPALDRMAIDQRKFENLRRLLDQLRKVEPIEAAIAERIEKTLLIDLAIPILARRRFGIDAHLRDPVR